MKIANIVSHSKVNTSKYFNVVETIDEIIIGLPTLIIGFDYVNTHYPNFDVMNIKLEDNFYWTVKRTEKRDKYEEDLSKFISNVISDLIIDINYVFVDVIQYNDKTIKKIIKKIFNINNKVTYQDGQMLYIYGDKLIFGVDLKLLKYIGLDYIKIKNKIKKHSIKFINNDDVLIEDKNIIDELNNKVRYIPYFYSLINDIS